LQDFLHAPERNIDDYLKNTEIFQLKKKRQRSSPSTGQGGLSLLVSNISILCYTVIDPMHNLLLGMVSFSCATINSTAFSFEGIAKSQWYNYWIQNGLRANTPTQQRELNIIHDLLESVSWFRITAQSQINMFTPLWAGCLPLRVGEPAGGSLTADEYKFAATGPWAIAVQKYYFPIQRNAHGNGRYHLYGIVFATRPKGKSNCRGRLSWEIGGVRER
jgi:hypothetical protein